MFINEIPGAEFEVNQVDDERIEIIAKRVVRKETDAVTAGNIADPNSKTSKSMARSTKMERQY